jgi:hypothetical protein
MRLGDIDEQVQSLGSDRMSTTITQYLNITSNDYSQRVLMSAGGASGGK